MMLLKVALRNIQRNVRRSVMTGLAIAMGALAMLTFGAFMQELIVGIETITVESTGHLAVLRKGYFEFGSGNPAAYGIDKYQSVIDTIKADPQLGPMINVITPGVSLFGIAGNFDIDASRSFFGGGVIPSDRDRMYNWDEHNLVRNRPPRAPGLVDDDPERGVIGVGLARILGLCADLKVPNCPAPPKLAETETKPDATGTALADLAKGDADVGKGDKDSALPHLDLLAATAGGAPNVVKLAVVRTERQGAKELDDAFIGMHLALAQQLVYGRSEHKATSIVLQLHRTEDMKAARKRLDAVFQEKGLDLEVRDFTELSPFFNQVVGLFGAIFVFIAVVMGVIVLFTVVNTMSMSVMERTNEIGTTRALGVRRNGIRWQFVAEGATLGIIGATAGVILAVIVAYAINHAGITWTPPGQSSPIPLRLLLTGAPLIGGVWLVLAIVATWAALIPANRAARMQVVDALRHV